MFSGGLTHTTWKVSKYGVFSGPYFPTFSQFRIHTVFSQFRLHTQSGNCFKFSLYDQEIQNTLANYKCKLQITFHYVFKSKLQHEFGYYAYTMIL